MSSRISELYASGLTLTQIANLLEIPYSRVRDLLLGAGVKPRSIAEAVKMSPAHRKHRESRRGVSTGRRSDEQRRHISEGRRAWAEKNAAGISQKATGYVVHTRGQDKHRSVHITIMECLIGRRLRRGEVVHHIDGDKGNNSPDNLKLMSNGDHVRLHRLQDIHLRVRDEKGRLRGSKR